MKKISLLLAVLSLLLVPAGIVAGEKEKAAGKEEIDKKAADEYFKHAGTAADPSFQDFIRTTTEQKKDEKAKEPEKTNDTKKGN